MNLWPLLATGLVILTVSKVNAADMELLQPPTGAQTSLSRVTVDAKGQLHLSWVKATEELNSLYHASLTGESWTAPKLIGEGEDWFVNWADFPFLSVNDSGMAAHWPKKSSSGTYDYNVAATFYRTETRRWSKPRIIHDDGVSAEHGFVSMLPMTEGRTFITWLDGRNTRSDATQVDGHASGGMTLRAGIFSGEGSTMEEWELDGFVCDCCQTSSAMTESGPVVVYRNRTEDEIRDTYITRMIEGRWTKPVAVHRDNWQVAGCPVNGPSVASSSGLTAVAWFTAKADMPKVQFVISQDDGKTFGDPVLVAEESTNGRISVGILDSGDIAISWLETHGTAAKVMLTRYDQQGKLKEKLTIAGTKSSRRSGFPVIASHDNEVYVTWTDILGEQPQVRVARVRF